jgi:predicted RNA-binding Zn ribbon-like protein
VMVTGLRLRLVTAGSLGGAMGKATRQEQPGGREPAPEPLGLVQDFLNTFDLEGEVEELTGPDQLRTWLVTRGLLGQGERVSYGDLERALAVRTGLRELAMANADLAVDEAAIRSLNLALGPALLQAHFGPAGSWRLDPGAPGVDGAVARLAAIVVEVMHNGTWSRLKPCRNHDCRWLFYDHSTNRSGTWCTMAICGNRLKARAYRRRHRP